MRALSAAYLEDGDCCPCTSCAKVLGTLAVAQIISRRSITCLPMTYVSRNSSCADPSAMPKPE